jgi:hypothetical protein
MKRQYALWWAILWIVVFWLGVFVAWYFYTPLHIVFWTVGNIGGTVIAYGAALDEMGDE